MVGGEDLLLILVSPDIEHGLGIHVSLGLFKPSAQALSPSVDLAWITEVGFGWMQTALNISTAHPSLPLAPLLPPTPVPQ